MSDTKKECKSRCVFRPLFCLPRRVLMIIETETELAVVGLLGWQAKHEIPPIAIAWLLVIGLALSLQLGERHCPQGFCVGPRRTSSPPTTDGDAAQVPGSQVLRHCPAATAWFLVPPTTHAAHRRELAELQLPEAQTQHSPCRAVSLQMAFPILNGVRVRVGAK